MRRWPRPARRQCWPSSAASSFPTFKPALADLAVEKLAPIAGEMRRISADQAYVDACCATAAQRAGVLAESDDEDGPRRSSACSTAEPHCGAPLAAPATAGGRLRRFISPQRGSHGLQTPEPRSRPPPQIPGDHRRHARNASAPSPMPRGARKNTGGVLVLLYVIEPGDFQHWLGVEKIMREEATATARAALDTLCHQGARRRSASSRNWSCARASRPRRSTS